MQSEFQFTSKVFRGVEVEVRTQDVRVIPIPP